MKRDDDLPDTRLTGSEEHAVRLVQACFGADSPEYVAFVRHLVCDAHGLPWLDEPLFKASGGGTPS